MLETKGDRESVCAEGVVSYSTVSSIFISLCVKVIFPSNKSSVIDNRQERQELKLRDENEKLLIIYYF